MGVSKFRAYILGNCTTIRTDHAPIMGLLRRTNLTGRCARWQCLLTEYELVLETRSGRKHKNADGLSRLLTADESQPVNSNEGQDDDLALVAFEVTGIDRFRKSPWYRDTLDAIFEGQEDVEGSEFRVEAGRLLHRGKNGQYQMCLLENEVASAISQCHTSVLGGHFAEEITLNRLAENFW